MNTEEWALHLHKTIDAMQHAAFQSEIEILLRNSDGDLKYRIERNIDSCTVFDFKGSPLTNLHAVIFDEIHNILNQKLIEIYDVASNTLSESLLLRLSQAKSINLVEKHNGIINYLVRFNNQEDESWILNSHNFSMKIKVTSGTSFNTIRNPDVVFQIFEVISDRVIEIKTLSTPEMQNV